MPPSSPQFTPAQVLQAGRRAESEGKPDLAERFFRHVVEHYGATPEAAAAREGLSRLGERRGERPLAVAVSPPAPFTATEGKEGPPPQVNGSNGEPAHPEAILRGDAGSGDEAAVDSAPAAVPVPGPPLAPQRAEGSAGPRRRYRSGRFVAWVAGLAGWLMVISGLALVPLAWTSKAAEWAPLLASPAGLAATAAWAAVQSFGGLILVLLAQVARAIFDMAEAGGGPG